MEFRILGPFEVSDDGRALALGDGRARALLALLLLHTNELVSADRLIDDLWGDAPPPTASKMVQGYVSKLRKVLGEGRLVTRSPGYVLYADRSELDLARFEELVAAAGREEPAQAARTLREALSLWRGPALADLAYERFAGQEIVRLEELRWAALEQRIDADLASGRDRDLIGAGGARSGAPPPRARPRAQLMLALYRAGRQADALAAYRDAHRELSERLGLEPSEELKRLERAILQHDPALDNETRHASTGRSLLVVPAALDGVDPLLRLVEPLAAGRELVIAAIVAPGEVGSATATLATRRSALLAGGIAARTAAFSSQSSGQDVVRLASRERVDLLVIDAPGSDLNGETGVVLDAAPCDVALLAPGGVTAPSGPVVVPFGAAWHDWAALELGAWMARATGAPLRLIGAEADGRDASRLLADASLIVQRATGVLAEPLLASPGRTGVFAQAEGARLLVVGLSERWRQEGLGTMRTRLVASPPAPTVLVRRGPRPGGLAPPEAITRFGWSLTAA